MSNEFGIYLKKLREDRKLTLRDVEEKARISNAYLSQVEQGKKGIPTIKILSRLAEAYGVSDMMNKAESASKEETIDTTVLAADSKFVARSYEKLPEDKKKAFQSYLQHLLNEAKKEK
jgi:transcriptional regulator with XRE-family HTH domain